MKMRMLCKILWILFLLPVQSRAQQRSADQDITGLWKGTLYNDSTQQSLHFELAISEENGKFVGYSYTVFEANGKKEIGVKQIRIKRKHDELMIEDVAMVDNNYSMQPPKGVRFKGEVNLSFLDTMMLLTGRWSTSPTREYAPLTGGIQVQRKSDFKEQELYQKLAVLKLDKDLSFVKNPRQPAVDIAKVKVPEVKKDTPVIAMNTPIEKPTTPVQDLANTMVPEEKAKDVDAPAPKETKKPEPVPVAEVPKKTPDIVVAPPIKKDTVVSRPVTVAVATPPVKKDTIVTKPVVVAVVPPPAKKETPAPVAVAPKPVETPKPVVKATVEEKKPVTVAVKETPKPVVKAQVAEKPVVTTPPVAVVTKPVATPVVKAPVKEAPKPVVVAPAAKPEVAKVDTPQRKATPVVAPTAAETAIVEKVAERKIAEVQSVFYISDSLTLTLYDNGEVDGDTVSVLMNGQVIFAKQGLTTKANSKVIYPGKEATDSLMLVMYAENLGSIPPNTGLLVVQDGESTFYVRFKADLQNNAAIMLRRKRK